MPLILSRHQILFITNTHHLSLSMNKDFYVIARCSATEISIFRPSSSNCHLSFQRIRTNQPQAILWLNFSRNKIKYKYYQSLLLKFLQICKCADGNIKINWNFNETKPFYVCDFGYCVSSKVIASDFKWINEKPTITKYQKKMTTNLLFLKINLAIHI